MNTLAADVCSAKIAHSISTDTLTSRRALLGGAIALPAIMTAAPARSEDGAYAAARSHWIARRDAYQRMEASDIDDEDVMRGLWAIIDPAENAILTTPSTHPRVAEWRVLIGWSHAQATMSIVTALHDGDIPALIHARDDLDWHEKLFLAVIEQLQTMAS